MRGLGSCSRLATGASVGVGRCLARVPPGHAGLIARSLDAPAHAEGTASTFVAEANLSREGVLTVKQTITFSGAGAGPGQSEFETRENLVGDRRQVFTVGEFAATGRRREP